MSATETVYLGSTYVEKGADVPDGYVLFISGTVDTDTIGDYEITYRAVNFAENIEVSTTKTVSVVDRPAPVITLNGFPTIYIKRTEEYTEEGAVADDGSTVTITNVPDVKRSGTYTIIYSAQNASKGIGMAVRNVHVVDEIPIPADGVSGIDLDGPPTVTVSGAETITLELGSTFTDPGIIVDDKSGTTTEITYFKVT
jgi:hypothetical protein